MKKNMILWTAALTFVLVTLVNAADNKTITTGLYVVPNSALTSDLETQLANKLKVTFSKSNIMLSTGAFPIVTVISYQESEVITIEGIRRSYKALGILTCSVVSLYDTAMLAAVQIEIEGVGTSKETARSNSIRSIDFSPAKMMPVIDKIRMNGQVSVDKYSAKVFQEAKTLKASQLYIEAIAQTVTIPKEYISYQDVVKFNQECEQLQLAKLEKEELARLKKEEEERALEREKIALEKYKADKKAETEKYKTDKTAEIELEKVKKDKTIEEAKMKKNEENDIRNHELQKIREENNTKIQLARAQNQQNYESSYRQLVQYIVSRY